MVSRRLSRQIMMSSKYGGPEWSPFSSRFVERFQDLPRQFGRVLRSKKKIQWIPYFAGSTGWLDTSKKSMKWKARELYARGMAEFPRILFGRERGNLRYARLGLIKWLMYSTRKTLRGKLPIRYQGLTLRFAVNVDVLFLNRYLY